MLASYNEGKTAGSEVTYPVFMNLLIISAHYILKRFLCNGSVAWYDSTCRILRHKRCTTMCPQLHCRDKKEKKTSCGLSHEAWCIDLSVSGQVHTLWSRYGVMQWLTLSAKSVQGRKLYSNQWKYLKLPLEKQVKTSAEYHCILKMRSNTWKAIK